MLDFAGPLCQSRNWNRSQRQIRGQFLEYGATGNGSEPVGQADRDGGGERELAEHGLEPDLPAEHEVAEREARAGAHGDEAGTRRAPSIEPPLLALLIADVILVVGDADLALDLGEADGEAGVGADAFALEGRVAEVVVDVRL